MTLRGILALTLATCLTGSAVATLAAQEKRASPHETVSAEIDGAKITITYGRPSMKGRKIVGGLVPYGQVWRTGADEATTLETTKALMFGNLHVNPGKVTLYSLPAENGWKLIVNKKTGQWGTDYDVKQDLGRADAKVEKLSAPVEQFTIAIEKNPAGKGGQIVMSWENTKVVAPFTVM
jgi:hypothetical protein